MKKISNKNIYVKNPETGDYESIVGFQGESAYDAAVRYGKTNLSEEKWVTEYVEKRNEAIEAIDNKGNAVLQTLPDDYIQMSSDVRQKAPAIFVDTSGEIVTIADGAAMSVKNLITHVEPVQEGSGDPSLNNIRAIVGWDKIDVAISKQNLFDGGDISVTTNKRHYLSVPLPAGTYTISAIPTLSSDTSKKTCGMTLFDTNGNSIQSHYFYKDINDGPQMYTVTVAVPIGSIRLQASDTNTNSQGHTATWSNIQIVPGDASQEFESYSGEALTTQLPETVYGGYADVVNGTGEKTMGFVELTGNENISLNSSETQGAGITIKGILPAIGNVDGICSHAITSPYLNTKNAMTLGRSNASWIYWTGILDTLGLSTVEEFKTWLAAQKTAGTPVQIAYQIAQPVPFQMEAQPISTQKGVNNIWSSTGEVDVTYAADTKLYIDRKLAQLAAAQLNA